MALARKRKKRKRRLTDQELDIFWKIMNNAPPDRKPGVRYFCKLFGVNQPSILKSVGDWRKPDWVPKPPKPGLIVSGHEPGMQIKGYTSKVDVDEEEIKHATT